MLESALILDAGGAPERLTHSRDWDEVQEFCRTTYMPYRVRPIERLSRPNSTMESANAGRVTASRFSYGTGIHLDKFDPDAGFRFSTYAIHWVRARLITHILLTEGVMRVSSSGRFKSLFFNYRRASAQIADTLRKTGQSLTRGEVQERTAKALGASVEDLRLIEAAMGTATALDAPIRTNGDGDTQTLADIIPSEAPLPEDILNEVQVSKYLKSEIAAAMEQLKPREQHIIATRKLAPKDEIMTLEELSQIYDVSRERIRQIEVNALKKLEKSLAPALDVLDAA